MNRVVVLALTALLVACGGSGPIPPADSQVTNDVVQWDAPTTRANGAPMAQSEIQEYHVRWAKVVGGPFSSANEATVAGTLLTWTRTNRPEGRACYTVNVQAKDSTQSVYIPAVCTEKCPLGKEVNAPGDCVAISPPNAPTNLRVS